MRWAVISLLILTILGGTLLSLAGCETTKGIGRDIQKASEAVEEALKKK